MSWGDPGIAKALRVSNGAVAWGSGGLPVNMPIQQTGILRRLMLLTSGSATVTAGTGTVARDVLGPWNAHTLVTVSPNQQAPIVNVSGYGLYLVNVVKAMGERMGNTPDTAIVSETSADAIASFYNFPTTTGTFRFYEEVPISQRIASLGGDIGMWPLQQPAMQLALAVTPNSATGATPYNLYSTTAGQAPYLTTGNATVTLGSTQEEPYRDLWTVPASQADLPPFQLVSTWIEEQPQGANVAGATSLTWLATPLSGILARIILYVYDSNVPGGVADSNLTASNALQLTYDANTVKFSESSYAAVARQASRFGSALPAGCFVYDLLGEDLTLQDTLNTFTIGNIKVAATFNAALGATSSAKIIRQIISPLEVK